MRVRRVVGAIARRAANLAGYDLLSQNIYSPLPRIEDLPEETFDRRSPFPGIVWDADRHESFLRELAPFLAEFAPPEHFRWDNPMYGPLESEVLYAVVRRFKPNRIVELGSGFTSLIIAAGCRRNADEGRRSHYTCFDPYPRDFIRQGIDGMDSLEAVGATAVPKEEFDTLADGDVLFIDTTHTVKVGGEVNRLVLEVLPTLSPGVLVHIHDIFLPYEYPRGFFENQCYWQEQYLVQSLPCREPELRSPFPCGCGLARSAQISSGNSCRGKSSPSGQAPSGFGEGRPRRTTANATTFGPASERPVVRRASVRVGQRAPHEPRRWRERGSRSAGLDCERARRLVRAERPGHEGRQPHLEDEQFQEQLAGGVTASRRLLGDELGDLDPRRGTRHTASRPEADTPGRPPAASAPAIHFSPRRRGRSRPSRLSIDPRRGGFLARRA